MNNSHRFMKIIRTKPIKPVGKIKTIIICYQRDVPAFNHYPINISYKILFRCSYQF